MKSLFRKANLQRLVLNATSRAQLVNVTSGWKSVDIEIIDGQSWKSMTSSVVYQTLTFADELGVVTKKEYSRIALRPHDQN